MVINGTQTSSDYINRRLFHIEGDTYSGGGGIAAVGEGIMEDVEEDALVEARPWSQAWYEFGLTSPIRGLKQITESTPFTIRRIFWVSFVLAGAAIFAYQMLNSILYYRSWPTAIDVKVHYNATLKFPAITICNQNAYRLTVAAQNNWYPALTKLYRGNLDMASLKNMAVYNDSMERILRTAAHTRQDLIVRCSWAGEECQPQDFHPTPTAIGICYTFNSGFTGAIKVVSGSGPGHGLRLQLNIEQYEYMAGPNEGAGLSIAVHDQQKAVVLPVHGLLVSPGEHTVIGLSMLQDR